jgi:hypothetical protein
MKVHPEKDVAVAARMKIHMGMARPPTMYPLAVFETIAPRIPQ